jgi:hypothetical protein
MTTSTNNTIDLKKLLQDCEKVLDHNWNGSFTIPSDTLYPHQWSWDAAFIAIGNSYRHSESHQGIGVFI